MGTPTSLVLSGNVLHYAFDTGLTITDTSGNNNTGILQGTGTASVTGQIGNALSFNGSGYITFTSVSQFVLASPASEFSFSCWVKTTQTDCEIFEARGATGVGTILICIGALSGVTGTGRPGFVTQGDNGVGFGNYGGSIAANPINDGNWHHFAGTRASNKTCTVYIDGVDAGSGPDGLGGGIGVTPVVANSAISGDVYSSANFLVGSLDDFQYYNRALTSTEVTSIYNAGLGSVANQWPVSATYAGAGALTAAVSQTGLKLFATLAGSGLLTTRLTQAIRNWSAQLVGGGAIIPPNLIQVGVPQSQQLRATFAGSGALNTTWYLAYVKAIHYPARISISATFAGEGDFQVVILPSDVNEFGTTDFVWPGIVSDAGSQVLYRQAAGLEKALADVDAIRLTATYAELIKDQWDPWRISSTNLPYLAWAMGVNLWEDDWPEEFKRWWVANQWTFKSQRGSRLGLINFVNTVNAAAGLTANVINVIQPPAQFFPGPALTPAEHAAYVARFPQLRLYPYAPRPQLPWLNYLGGKTYDQQGNPVYVKNGRFFGPYLKFYPTNFNAGGLYLRKCTLYEPRTGVETQLTVRTITAVPQPGQAVTTFDEITLPANSGNLFYPGKGNKKYLLAPHAVTQNLRHAVVLGRLPRSESRIIRIPRDGTLDRTQYQAIFQTISPNLTPINVRPEWVYEKHPMRKTEFYCGQCLTKKFQPKTNAGQYLYERWYLFDPTRQPDYRAGYIYMGRARFGIPKYTAQAKIEAYFPWPKFYARAGGFIGKGYFFPPRNTKLVDKIRRAVTASMAVRDTVRIDTRVKRVLEIRDLTELDGRFIIGQYIKDSGFGATPTSHVSRSAANQPPLSVVPR